MSDFVPGVVTVSKNKENSIDEFIKSFDNDPINKEHVIKAVRECRKTGKIVIPGKMRKSDANKLIKILQESQLIGTHLTGGSNDPEQMIEHIAKMNISWPYSLAVKFIERKSPYFYSCDQDRLETIWNTYCVPEQRTLILA